MDGTYCSLIQASGICSPTSTHLQPQRMQHVRMRGTCRFPTVQGTRSSTAVSAQSQGVETSPSPSHSHATRQPVPSTGVQTGQVKLSPTPTPKRGNEALRGNFRPVASEHPDSTRCQVLGKLPEELRGQFLRNGSNPQFPPSPDNYHWFDGDGMVHCVDFREEGVFYSSRFVRTTAFELEAAASRSLFAGLGTGAGEAPASLAHITAKALGLCTVDSPLWNGGKNTANTHLVYHAGQLLALWEAGYPYRIELQGLDTMGVHTFGGALNSPFTAHPKVDPVTGHLIYFGYILPVKPHLVYGVVDSAGKIIHTADIGLETPVFMHDFAITENYSIFLDFPVVFSIERMIRSSGSAKAFQFDPSHPARIGVMPRFGDKESVRWFNVQPGYVAHVMNAYEEKEEDGTPGGTTVVLRGARFTSFSAFGVADIADSAKGSADDTCSLWEWRLDLASGAVQERELCEVSSDFPCINQLQTGRKHRYGYSARFATQPGPGKELPKFDAILKHDFKSGTTQTHFLGPRRFGGEPVFAPRDVYPEATRDIPSSTRGVVRDEDDGWLLVHVRDERHRRSEVIVLDAKNIEAPPVASIWLPFRVPYGFHGIFVRSEEKSHISG